MPQLDLEIIIVTFNSQFWLKKTLSSMSEFYLAKTKRTVQVTVVDNHSEDETLVMLRREFKWVKVIELSSNLGFAAANNLAIAQSSATYVMLCNSDVEFTNQSNLDILLTYLDEHPQTGVITPRLEFTSGDIDRACHRGEPTLWASATHFLGLENLFPNSKFFSQYHQTYKDFNSFHTIDACSGAAMIVRQSLLKTVGMLDERFFMYAEDLDWCHRFRDEGHLIMFYPQVKLIHHKNKSGIKSSSQKLAIKTRHHFYNTMLQYYDKYYRTKYPEVVRIFIKYFLFIKKGAL